MRYLIILAVFTPSLLWSATAPQSQGPDGEKGEQLRPPTLANVDKELIAFPFFPPQTVSIGAWRKELYKAEWTNYYLTGDWRGVRNRLAAHGLTSASTYVFDVLGNPVGGMSQGTRYYHSMGLDINLDLEKAAGLKGTKFGVSGLYRAGRSLSKDCIGNVFVVSSLVGPTQFRFYGLFLEQSLLEDRFNIRVGRMCPGDDFAHSPLYWVPLNNAIDGNPIALPIHFSMFSYPNATWGTRVKLKLTESFYSLSGIYNGDPNVPRLDAYGLDFTLRLQKGIFYAQEFGYELNQGEDDTGMPGNYKFGALYHSGPFDDQYLDKDDNPYVLTGRPQKEHQGNYNYYFHLDQMVYREAEGSDQGLTPYVVFTLGPADVNQFPFFVDGALIYKGLIPNRDLDQTSLGFAYGKFSWDLALADRQKRDYQGSGCDPRKYELMLDLSHKIVLQKMLFLDTQWMFIEPDVQYIIRPGGTGDIDNALVCGARFGFNF